MALRMRDKRPSVERGKKMKRRPCEARRRCKQCFVDIESPLTPNMFLCERWEKLKSTAAITLKRGPEEPSGTRKTTMLSADCYAENTLLCEISHKSYGGSRINENHRAFPTFPESNLLVPLETSEISVFQISSAGFLPGRYL